MEDIYSGKSIWDDDAVDWIDKLMEQAEEEAKEMEERDFNRKKQEEIENQMEEEEEDEEIEDEFLFFDDDDEDYQSLSNTKSKNNKNYSFFSDDESIKRTIQKESGGNPNAVSSAGARGLMQIMPIALEDYNNINGTSYSMDDMFDPELNVEVGSWYKHKRIPEMLRHYNLPINEQTIDAAYNGGIGRVKNYYQKGISLPKETQNYSGLRQYGGFIPSGTLKKAQFNFTFKGATPSDLEIDKLIPKNDSATSLNNEGVNWENISNYVSKGVSAINNINDFVKERKNNILTGIENGIDNSISYLSNIQNANNLMEYEKRMNEKGMNENRYNSLKQTDNKQVAYI